MKGKGTLLTILSALVVAFILWGGSSIVSNGQRLSTLEAQQQSMKEWLTRIEGKLDQALRPR